MSRYVVKPVFFLYFLLLTVQIIMQDTATAQNTVSSTPAPTVAPAVEPSVTGQISKVII